MFFKTTMATIAIIFIIGTITVSATLTSITITTINTASAKEGTPPHGLKMLFVEQPYGSNEEESEQQPSEVRAVDCAYSGLYDAACSIHWMRGFTILGFYRVDGHFELTDRRFSY